MTQQASVTYFTFFGWQQFTTTIYNNKLHLSFANALLQKVHVLQQKSLQLAGESAPTRLATVCCIGCINAIKLYFCSQYTYLCYCAGKLLSHLFQKVLKHNDLLNYTVLDSQWTVQPIIESKF